VNVVGTGSVPAAGPYLVSAPTEDSHILPFKEHILPAIYVVVVHMCHLKFGMAQRSRNLRSCPPNSSKRAISGYFSLFSCALSKRRSSRTAK